MKEIAIGSLSLYEFFAFFFTYSFLGWVMEVASHAITTGKFINRGFLNGPVCPIYGTGVVIILLLLGDGIEKTWLVFLVGVLFPTLIELVTGWFLEKFCHNRWWDYSKEKFNLHGYICLKYSLIWGFAATFVLKLVHPLISKICNLVNDPLTYILSIIFAVSMVADLIVTIMQVAKLNKKITELDEITKKMRVASNFIGEKVTEVTLAAEKGVNELKEKTEEKHQEYEEWQKRRKETLSSIPKRLIKAFPNLKNKEKQEAIDEAKKEINK